MHLKTFVVMVIMVAAALFALAIRLTYEACLWLARTLEDRKMRRVMGCGFLIALGMLALAALTGCDGQEHPRQTGPVVFIGDSIIAQWTDLCASYAPGDCVNAGVGGQTSIDILERFDRDVIALHPRAVVIFAGTNDMIKSDTYNVDCIESMAEEATMSGIRVVLAKITSGDWHHYKDADNGPLSLAQTRGWNGELEALAYRNGYDIVDLYTPTLTSAGTQDTRLFADWVHPNAAGHAAMLPAVLAEVKP